MTASVSVVIPAFNRSELLREALRSVLAQSYVDWECVVVDDGSSEDLSFAGTLDPRIRLIRQPNQGVSMARNRGIANSAGELVAFLDSDDLWLPTKLEKQVAAMNADPSVGLCHTDYAVLGQGGNKSSPPTGAGRLVDFYTMLALGPVLPTTTMVRRSALRLLGLFDPFLTPSEDQDLFARIARFYKVSFIPTCEALYRVHGANTTGNYMVCYRTMRNLAQRHEINARYRRDTAALSAARAMMPYRRRQFFGPQAFDAARLALGRRELATFLAHITRAVIWSPVYTIGSIAKFPLRRKARR